jgi:hypothetical protein
VVLTIDGNTLRSGLHFINVRAQNDLGLWGPLKRDFFYIPQANENPSSIACSYEYWVDNDHAHKTVAASSEEAVVLTIDGNTLRSGLHFINVRAQNDLGLWGPLKRDFFYIPSNEDDTDGGRIVGYEYAFGSFSKYESVTPCTNYELKQHIIQIPDSSGFGSLEEGCTWKFAGDKVTLYRKNYLTVSIRFLNEASIWSIPESEQFELSDTITKTACILASGQQHTFTKAAAGSYEVVRIDISETRDYYLQATQSCRIQLYTAEGALLKTIASDALAVGERCELEAGKSYYAIIYKMVTDTDYPLSQISVKLLLEANMVLTPTITYANEMVTITNNQEGASVYYTIDGTNPTSESTFYIVPFTLQHNAIIKAIAVSEGMSQSEVAEYVVDTYKVSDVTFFVDSITLSLHTETPNAVIYYGIGEDAKPELPYTVPIVLQDNRPIKAIAKREYFCDSEVTTYEHSLFTCPDVVIGYNGHNVTLTSIEGAAIYYTTDGTEPTINSALYSEPFSVLGLCTVKTFAVKKWMNDAKPTSLEVKYVYDGELAIVKEAGLLNKAFEWCGTPGVKTLRIQGPVDESDFTIIRQLPNLLTLDMEQSQLKDLALPANALQGATMRWFCSPTNLNKMGSGVFNGCRQLATITWNSISCRITADAFGGNINPNILYYVKSENLVAIDNANIISNGRARNITLHDGTAYSDFFCPVSFRADNISYTHNYRQKTQKGMCMGWETLALPFTVQTITHWKNGEMVPFAAKNAADTRKLFWLAKLNALGFVATDVIEANTPYILSMPNDSVAYADRNLLAGDVTFSAYNTEIPATDTKIHVGEMADVKFIPNFGLRQPSPNIYSIYLYAPYDSTHPEGSTFLSNYRQLRPFEAYTTSDDASASRYMSIIEMLGETTGIFDVMFDTGIADMNTVRVYNFFGSLVKSGNYVEVMKNLSKGIYIINGKKVIVK